MDPITLAAILGTTGLLGSSILGSTSASASSRSALEAQRLANQTNLEIADKTNAANYRNWQMYAQMQRDLAAQSNELQRYLLQSQQGFNAQEAELNREYNSAQAQVQRLLAAGLNPHGVTAGQSETQASSGLASPQTADIAAPPSASPTQVQPERYDAGAGLRAVSDALANFSQLGLSFAQTKLGSDASRYATQANASAKAVENTIKAQDLAVRKELGEKSYELQKEAQRKNIELQDNLIEQGNAEIERLQHQNKMDTLANQREDERLLKDWFVARSGARLSDAQASQAAAMTADIQWMTQNMRPVEQKSLRATILKVREEIRSLAGQNQFSKDTYDSRVNSVINDADMSSVNRMMLRRAFNNLKEIDGKQWLLVINSALSFFGGAGITPGYSVK